MKLKCEKLLSSFAFNFKLRLYTLAQQCVNAKGPSPSPELDRLLSAIIEVDAPAAVAVCSNHLDAWFIAHAAELLVAASGEGASVGEADPTAGALGPQAGRALQEYLLQLALEYRGSIPVR